MKGSADAVLTEDLCQTVIEFRSVVIAHGERLRTALRIEIFEHHDSLLRIMDVETFFYNKPGGGELQV